MLKACFPAFGGKARIASRVWSYLGDVTNYIEPFCFSAANLLLRPHDPKTETLNDLNSYVANFWRAVKHDPQAVASHADWPVIEDDMHARHKWLVRSDAAKEALAKVRTDPDFYDAKIAGWWCWGACMWIGSGWCEQDGCEQIPHISNNHGQGVHRKLTPKRPGIGNSRGIHRELSEQLQRLSCGSGQGVNRVGRPQLADAYSRGRGVHGNDAMTTCERRLEWLTDWMMQLADRLRVVRVCCGHWMRVCDSHSTMTRLGLTGVFLDPPYRHKLEDGTNNRHTALYANDQSQDIDALCDEVQEWCVKWGDDRSIRIVLCGLEGEYPKLDHWRKVEWKSGGYGNRTERGKTNAARERLWISPHCLSEEITLFGAA